MSQICIDLVYNLLWLVLNTSSQRNQELSISQKVTFQIEIKLRYHIICHNILPWVEKDVNFIDNFSCILKLKV